MEPEECASNGKLAGTKIAMRKWREERVERKSHHLNQRSPLP